MMRQLAEPFGTTAEKAFILHMMLPASTANVLGFWDGPLRPGMLAKSPVSNIHQQSQARSHIRDGTCQGMQAALCC